MKTKSKLSSVNKLYISILNQDVKESKQNLTSLNNFSSIRTICLTAQFEGNIGEHNSYTIVFERSGNVH